VPSEPPPTPDSGIREPRPPLPVDQAGTADSAGIDAPE
jgi:hypothetical protein